MVDNDEGLIQLDHIYLVTEDLTHPERYVAKAGSVVFRDFTRAWDHLLCPMWGDRTILTTHTAYRNLSQFRNSQDTEYTYALRLDLDGWRRFEPEDLTLLSMESTFNGEMFPGRALSNEYSWINSMTKKLVQVRGSALGAKSQEFNTNELRTIFEILPDPLHRYLSAFITGLANAREMAETKCTAYQNEISKLKRESEKNPLDRIRELQGVAPSPSTGIASPEELMQRLTKKIGRIT